MSVAIMWELIKYAQIMKSQEKKDCTASQKHGYQATRKMLNSSER